MNTIRPQQNGEPASERRSLDGQHIKPGRLCTDVKPENVGVVGGSMSGKANGVNTGGLPVQEIERFPAEVRADVVAKKSGNADGAKEGRKADEREHQRFSTNTSLTALKWANGRRDKILRTECERTCSGDVKQNTWDERDEPASRHPPSESDGEASNGRVGTTGNWRAGCGKTASPVRWEGRGVISPSLPYPFALPRSHQRYFDAIALGIMRTATRPAVSCRMRQPG